MARLETERYVLHQLIARGGMAEVFSATRVLPGAPDLGVVVKRVSSRGAPEAELMSRLHHPNIVEVVDFGPGRGDDYFLVLELVDGLTLGRFRNAYEMRGELLPLPIVLAIGVDVLTGLAHVHESSARVGQLVVHRDVSPENILLSDTGSVKLSDFGVALVRSQGDEEEDDVVVGKPRYMAPEQLIGGVIDARTDVFSVGVVLFEAMTGDSPFAGASEAERQAAAYAGEIRQARSLRPEVPLELSAIVRQACASRSENRFGSARQMLDALLRVGRSELAPAPRHELAAAIEAAHRLLRTPSESPRSGMQRPVGELARGHGPTSAFALALNRATSALPEGALETLRGR